MADKTILNKKAQLIRCYKTAAFYEADKPFHKSVKKVAWIAQRTYRQTKCMRERAHAFNME